MTWTYKRETEGAQSSTSPPLQFTAGAAAELSSTNCAIAAMSSSDPTVAALSSALVVVAVATSARRTRRYGAACISRCQGGAPQRIEGSWSVAARPLGPPLWQSIGAIA
eukprot:COSAG06_NODE_1603_length_8956_cov_6.771029_2_plen_109_part_00